MIVLNVFKTTTTNENIKDFDYFTNIIKNSLIEFDGSLFKISGWTSINIIFNNINFELQVYDTTLKTKKGKPISVRFNLQEKRMFMMGDVVSSPKFKLNSTKAEIDWGNVQDTYRKYADIPDQFIRAIKDRDLETAKKLNREHPDIAKPSIENSEHTTLLIKTGNVEFIKWAEKVDGPLKFAATEGWNASFLDNPMKIAIDLLYEDMAIWLIDNNKVSMFIKRNKTELIELAYTNKLYNLVDKMCQNQEMIDAIIQSGKSHLFPESIRELFVFETE